MSDTESEVSRVTALLEGKLARAYPARRPPLRLITAADLPPKPPALYTDDQRDYVRDRIRMWTRIYGLEQWTRQKMAGFVTLEELPDDDLRRLLETVERGVQAIRDGIGFDEVGLMD